VVSANLRQSCNHLSKFLQHDHRYAPDDLPFGSPVYYLPANRGRPSASSRKAPGLGTLRSALDWPFTFYPWSPSRKKGRNPQPTFQSEWLCNLSIEHIHTPVSPPLARLLSFRTSSPAYPHDPLVADRLLSTDTVPIRLAAVLGCSTLNLYRPPTMFRLIESLLLAPTRNHVGFTRPSLRFLRMQPLEDCTHANLALASLSAS